MRFLLVGVLVVFAGCGLGMMGRGSELAAPSVSALTQQADGTESVRLTWSEAAVTREFLDGVTATSGGAWLTGTRVSGDRELQLSFARGFAQALAGQGPYAVTLTLPDQRRMHSCACCQHAEHTVTVVLEFDAQGALGAPKVTQQVR